MLAGIPQDGYVFKMPLNLGWGSVSEAKNTKYSWRTRVGSPAPMTGNSSSRRIPCLWHPQAPAYVHILRHIHVIKNNKKYLKYHIIESHDR